MMHIRLNESEAKKIDAEARMIQAEAARNISEREPAAPTPPTQQEGQCHQQHDQQ